MFLWRSYIKNVLVNRVRTSFAHLMANVRAFEEETMDNMDIPYESSELMVSHDTLAGVNTQTCLLFNYCPQSSEFFDSVLSLEQEGLIDNGLAGNFDDDMFLSSETGSHIDEVNSINSLSSTDCDKWSTIESIAT